MEAKELRIGNYVQYASREAIFKVTQIDEDSAYIESEEDAAFNGSYYYKYSIKPIPLTEEWLLKFGLELWYMDLFSFGKFSIKFSDSLKLWEVKTITTNLHESETIATVKYVHQLQNLYWCLCGEELTLKK